MCRLVVPERMNVCVPDHTGAVFGRLDTDSKWLAEGLATVAGLDLGVSQSSIFFAGTSGERDRIHMSLRTSFDAKERR